jgi:hypothetical protein
MTQGNIKPIQAAEHPIDPGGGLVPLFGELDLGDLLSEPAL